LPGGRLYGRYDRLVRTPSVTGSEEKAAEYIAGELERMGLEAEWSWYEEGRWPSLYAESPGTDPAAPSMLMMGHIDTVAVAEGWRTDPFSPVVDGDRVYGLGTMDMKGGLAAILEAVNRFIESGASKKARGTLKLAFVADEEGLSRGTYKLLRDGLSADMALMADCGFDGISVGFRGRYSFNAEVRGVSAHASLYPEAGRNAVIDAGRLAERVEALPTKTHPEAGSGTWCVRHMEGGVKETLSVPDKCSLFIDRYVVPGETSEGCAEQIMEAARSLGLEGNVSVGLVPRPTPYMESFVVDKNLPLLKSVEKNYRDVTGDAPALRIDRSVCDSNYLVTLGKIPTVTLGPSGEGLHGPNEYGSIREIGLATEIYLKTLEDMLL
jgi:succinyl-diaminopimelate desuccinylase